MTAQLHPRRLTRLLAVGLINDGFDWGSAAIGVGGAGALALLIAGGGFTYRTRHQHDQMGVAR